MAPASYIDGSADGGSQVRVGACRIEGVNFEQNGLASVYVKNAHGVYVEKCYPFQAPIILDEQSWGCAVRDCDLFDNRNEEQQVGGLYSYGAGILDNGFFNVTGPNKGQAFTHPGIRAGKTLQELMPNVAPTALPVGASSGWHSGAFRRSAPIVDMGPNLPWQVVNRAITVPVPAGEHLIEVIWCGQSLTVTDGVKSVTQTNGDFSIEEFVPKLIRFVSTGPATLTITAGANEHYIWPIISPNALGPLGLDQSGAGSSWDPASRLLSSTGAVSSVGATIANLDPAKHYLVTSEVHDGLGRLPSCPPSLGVVPRRCRQLVLVDAGKAGQRRADDRSEASGHDGGCCSSQSGDVRYRRRDRAG